MHVPMQSTVLGRNLRHWRHRRNLTQRALADKAGVHCATVTDIERGRRRTAHGDTLQAFAQVLKIQVDDLLSEGAL
jgi:transcriptional regulator with XRE-family HTH domain